MFAQTFIALPFLEQCALVFFIAINIIAFFFFGLDKLKSRLVQRRISEQALWVVALLGGSVGALAGMYFFHHKTQKPSFQVGLAVIIVIQILLFLWYIM